MGAPRRAAAPWGSCRMAARRRQAGRLKQCRASVHSSAVDHVHRRAAVLSGGLAVALPARATTREADVITVSSGSWSSVSSELLAYSFALPTQADSGRSLRFVVTRKPERYSSAAPLSPDARQRITCEYVDFSGPFIASVSVGPPNPRLKSIERSEWNDQEIAQEVLADRSPAKASPGRRVPASEIRWLEEHEQEGTTYLVYEHVAQGSPSLVDSSAETYKCNVASTAERNGYFYTFNLSAPAVYWDEVGSVLYQSALSFRLIEPGKKFVSPEKQPWRFW